MCSPIGFGLVLYIPRKNQATWTPRKVWAVICACSQLGGNCRLWGWDRSSGILLLPQALSLVLAVAYVPLSGIINFRHAMSADFDGHPLGSTATVCEYMELVSWRQESLVSLAGPGFTVDSLSCVVLARSEYLQGSQPLSSPWGLTH